MVEPSWPGLTWHAGPATGHNKKQIPLVRTARILVAIPAHRGAPSGGVRVAERGAVSAGRLAHDRRRLVSRQPAPSDAPAARGSKGCAKGGQGSAWDRPQRGNPDGHPWWSRGAPSLRSRLAPVSPDGAFAQTTAAGASEAPIFGLPGWRCSSTRHPLVSHKRRGAPGRARQGREKEARQGRDKRGVDGHRPDKDGTRVGWAKRQSCVPTRDQPQPGAHGARGKDGACLMQSDAAAPTVIPGAGEARGKGIQ